MSLKAHQHGVCSNSHETFSTFVGCTVKGFLKNCFPLGRRDLSAGTKTLLFECGWGLTVSSKGSYWVESPEDVKRAINYAKKELATAQREIRDVLALAGEPAR